MKVLSLPDFRAANPYQSLLADGVARQGVTVVHSVGYKRVFPILRAVSQETGIRVLHLHWLHPYIRGRNTLMRFIYASRLLFELQMLRWRGIKIVWTVHNLASHDTSSPRLEKWLSERVARLSDRLIVHSEGAKSDIISEFGARSEQIVVVPHGSYEDAYGERLPKSKARANLNLSSDVPVALFFGLVRPYKNVLKLLDAWPLIVSAFPSAQLLVYGSAPEASHRADVEKSASALDGVTIDLRFVPDAEVSTLFGAADVVVLPFEKSLTSGTISLAETYGTPVVVPDVEGARCAQNATFARSLEPEDLADAVIATLEERESRSSSKSITVSWDDIAAVHISAYELTD